MLSQFSLSMLGLLLIFLCILLWIVADYFGLFDEQDEDDSRPYFPRTHG